MIPVNEPLISKEAKENVNIALESGWISSAGTFVKQFEEDFASYLGVKHAISVSNGTAALHVALLSLDIGPGDEIIIPAFTMAATWLAVLYTGAKPVFVDCEPETYNINVNLIEEKINEKTKAIIPVHIYGHPADMDPIILLAKRHKLYIIEDAAEAHGAEYKKRKCGSMGDINCFSFYGNKIITCGEGGMVVTNDEDFANKARKIKDLYHSDKKRFIHEKVGYNYRLTNTQAAIGCGELNHIEEYVTKKQQMASRYTSGLSSIEGITTPKTKSYAKNVFWMYSILVDENKYGISKDKLREKLKQVGIDTRDFFYSPSDQPILKQFLSSTDIFPVTDYISNNGCYLPSGLAITNDQIDLVISTIKAYKKP